MANNLHPQLRSEAWSELDLLEARALRPRLLLAGLGSIGRRHLENLLRLGIPSDDLILLRTGRATLPDSSLVEFPREADLRAALETHRPDAVIVSNPTACHMEVAQEAAARGCHLFIEKPLSHSFEGVRELETTAWKMKAKTQVGFHFRFNPGLQRAASYVKKGKLGRLFHFRATWGEYLPDWHKWEDYRQGYAARRELGGGALLTLCHPFHYIAWLLGEIECVGALTDRTGLLEIDVEDSAEIILQLKNGLVGSLHLDYLRRPTRHELEISGSEGVLHWDGLTGRLEWTPTSSSSRLLWNPPEGFERNSMFLAEMEHFLRCMELDESPAVSLADGIAALRATLAAGLSAETGRMVSLSEMA